MVVESAAADQKKVGHKLFIFHAPGSLALCAWISFERSATDVFIPGGTSSEAVVHGSENGSEHALTGCRGSGAASFEAQAKAVAARLLSERQRLGSCPFHMVVKSMWAPGEFSLRKFLGCGADFCGAQLLVTLRDWFPCKEEAVVDQAGGCGESTLYLQTL